MYRWSSLFAWIIYIVGTPDDLLVLAIPKVLILLENPEESGKFGSPCQVFTGTLSNARGAVLKFLMPARKLNAIDGLANGTGVSIKAK